MTTRVKREDRASMTVEEAWQKYTKAADWPQKYDGPGKTIPDPTVVSAAQRAFEAGAKGETLKKEVARDGFESFAYRAGRRFAREHLAEPAPLPERKPTMPSRGTPCLLCGKTYRCEGCKKPHQECECNNGNLFGEHPAVPASATRSRR